MKTKRKRETTGSVVCARRRRRVWACLCAFPTHVDFTIDSVIEDVYTKLPSARVVGYKSMDSSGNQPLLNFRRASRPRAFAVARNRSDVEATSDHLSIVSHRPSVCVRVRIQRLDARRRGVRRVSTRLFVTAFGSVRAGLEPRVRARVRRETRGRRHGDFWQVFKPRARVEAMA